MQRIEEQWKGFVAACYEPDVDPCQLDEQRRIFFAGAVACRKLMQEMAATLTDAQIMTALDELTAELTAFGDSLSVEFAKRDRVLRMREN
jgi:hypothetical protein